MSLPSIDMLMREMRANTSLGRYQEALQQGQTLLAMLPRNAIDQRALVSYDMAGCYNKLGQYAEAEASYAAAVPADTENAVLWWHRVRNQRDWAKAASGPVESRTHFQKAFEYAKEAQRLDPDDRDILLLVSEIRRESW